MRRGFALAVFALAGACGGRTVGLGAGSRPDVYDSLSRVDPVALDAGCPAGGYAIRTGLDTNHNGILDDAEATSSSIVCGASAPAHSTLVRVSQEPPDDHCTSGGSQVETGTDLNDDGVLSASEVRDTQYVCNGAAQAAGAVRTTIVPWGDVCKRGGLRVEIGGDTNDSGVLDDAEVQHTDTVCNLYYTDIDAGETHSCALVSDKTVRCWGSNFFGRLGDGTTTQRNGPVRVKDLTGATAISAGGYGHSCALLDDGTVSCWGVNDKGQLGDGTTTERHAPGPVPGLSGVIGISVGYLDTCAVLATGGAKCWGINENGELGDGTTENRLTATDVQGLTNVKQISAGRAHTCAVLADGTARCWGDNLYGRCGDGTGDDRLVPTLVEGITTATMISAGGYHTCAVLSDGTAKCWGYDLDGQVGDGTAVTEKIHPAFVKDLTKATSITSGNRHSCALRSTGTVRCWGSNDKGQLGDGNGAPADGGASPNPTFVAVSGLTGATAVSAGEEHTCAIVEDGTARCWGQNLDGQLGDGTTVDRSTPVPVYNAGSL
jgi:alpha-tubulin suppressor-like RCC1 family protein